jgi:hypothetical protein
VAARDGRRPGQGPRWAAAATVPGPTRAAPSTVNRGKKTRSEGGSVGHTGWLGGLQPRATGAIAGSRLSGRLPIGKFEMLAGASGRIFAGIPVGWNVGTAGAPSESGTLPLRLAAASEDSWGRWQLGVCQLLVASSSRFDGIGHVGVPADGSGSGFSSRTGYAKSSAISRCRFCDALACTCGSTE